MNNLRSPQAERIPIGGILSSLDPEIRCATIEPSSVRLGEEEGPPAPDSEEAMALASMVEPTRKIVGELIRNCLPGGDKKRPLARRGPSSAKHFVPKTDASTPVNTGLSQPLPPPPPDSGPDEGGQNGGGNPPDGGNGKKKKNGGKNGSGEHVAVNESMEGMLPPTPDVVKALSQLDRFHNIKEVRAVALYPTSQNQREYRERLFGPPMWAIIHELQKNPALKAIETEVDPAKRVEKYYAILAAADAYKSGNIPEGNIALMLGLKKDDDLMKLICSTEGGKVIRKTSIELAPGNGEISRTFRDICDRFLPLAHLQHMIPQKGKVLREVYTNAYNNAVGIASNARKSVDPFIQGVDIVPKFVEKGRKKLIDARKGDICDPLEALYDETGLAVNDADYVVGNLFFDRVDNLNDTLRFAKTLAKPDGSTQFLFGFYAPFSPKTISFSKNENIPEFECFDPFEEDNDGKEKNVRKKEDDKDNRKKEDDIRKTWVSSDPAKPLSRAETIYQIILSLNHKGFNTTRVAEHEYEVYSAHCIAETAGVLRTDPKYAFLKEYDFKDEELNARRDDVFNGVLHNDELVGFPERENIILISGNITVPEDGKPYEKIDFETAVKQKRLDVDPTQPRFGFLKDYVFPRRRFGKLRDKIFREGKPAHLPFRAHMKASMIEANKRYLKAVKEKARKPSSNK